MLENVVCEMTSILSGCQCVLMESEFATPVGWIANYDQIKKAFRLHDWWLVTDLFHGIEHAWCNGVEILFPIKLCLQWAIHTIWWRLDLTYFLACDLTWPNWINILSWCWWNFLTSSNQITQIGSCDRSRIQVPDPGGTGVWPGWKWLS